MFKNSNIASRFILLLFLILSAINIYGEHYQQSKLIYATRPFLITTLCLWFFVATMRVKTKFHWFILLGLVLSVAGDCFLMISEKNNGKGFFFIAGLGHFLLAHLAYFSAFLQHPYARKKRLIKRPWLFFPFLFFLTINMIYLWPAIPHVLKGSILIYTFVIICMAGAALNLKGLLPGKLFPLLFLGVTLTILSDYLNALNKFQPEGFHFPFIRIAIMLTYLTGQYLIASRSAKLTTYN